MTQMTEEEQELFFAGLHNEHVNEYFRKQYPEHGDLIKDYDAARQPLSTKSYLDAIRAAAQERDAYLERIGHVHHVGYRRYPGLN